jgi:hypothetical protein
MSDTTTAAGSAATAPASPERQRGRGCGPGTASVAQVRRGMPRLLAGAGFSLDWSRPFILAEIGRQADYFGGFCAAFRVLLPKAGAMTEAEADAFVGGLERDMAEGRFFGSCAFYAYVARRGG